MTTYRLIGNIVLHKAGMIVMGEACFTVDRGVVVLEIGARRSVGDVGLWAGNADSSPIEKR